MLAAGFNVILNCSNQQYFHSTNSMTEVAGMSGYMSSVIMINVHPR
uniref:Uncharacterized protein n=1 Tax=Rhizophora mucronata TaxID=61149 RepID=A0A2P2LIL0_RHIMU